MAEPFPWYTKPRALESGEAMSITMRRGTLLGATLVALLMAPMALAADEVEIAPGLRVETSRGIPATRYVLAGIDVASGKTRWVTPRETVQEALGSVPQQAVEELLERGWQIEELSRSEGGIVVVAMRMP